MKTPLIQVHHLKYKYPNSHRFIINDVSFNVHKGAWASLIGLNGSGKSTLIKLLDGLLTAKSGQIIIDSRRLSAKTLLPIRSEIGIVFQNPKDQFVGATVKDEIAFGLENHQISTNQIQEDIRWALKMVGMRPYENTLVDDLSGGQQQRVAIADVIALRPKIVILDECTSMLDPQGRVNIMNLILDLQKKLHLTIIDITHDISETRYAQKIMVMDNGKLVLNGSPKQIFDHEAVLKKLHLGLPPSDILRDLLQKRGVKVPHRHFSQAGMILWLRKLFLNR